MRVYPPIEPQMTVGEYLDRKIVKYPLPDVGRFTDSDDKKVERFWKQVTIDFRKVRLVRKIEVK